MEDALRAWAATCAAGHPEIRRVGYFGSYARGDWGVGSDLDIVIVLNDETASVPFERRAAAWDVTGLPVPTDVLVYTQTEWQALMDRGDRFARMLKDEIVWIR